MEQDRYQQSHAWFITGLIALVACIGFTGFTLYFTPPLIWSWNYQIPQFIWDWQAFMQRDWGWSELKAGWTITGIFLSLGIISGLIAYTASNRIDDAIYHVRKKIPEGKTDAIAEADTREAHSLEMKIFLLILLVIIGAVILQWFFSLTA